MTPGVPGASSAPALRLLLLPLVALLALFPPLEARAESCLAPAPPPPAPRREGVDVFFERALLLDVRRELLGPADEEALAGRFAAAPKYGPTHHITSHIKHHVSATRSEHFKLKTKCAKKNTKQSRVGAHRENESVTHLLPRIRPPRFLAVAAQRTSDLLSAEMRQQPWEPGEACWQMRSCWWG